MSEFPSLKPAFTMMLHCDPILDIGSTSRNNPLIAVPISSGELKSAAGFPLELDAELALPGQNFLHGDADTEYTKPDAHSVFRTTDGAVLYIRWNGVYRIGEEERRVTSLPTGSAETQFGSVFMNFTIQTGDKRYQELENGVFVGQGRFHRKDGKTTTEYRVSQVVKG